MVLDQAQRLWQGRPSLISRSAPIISFVLRKHNSIPRPGKKNFKGRRVPLRLFRQDFVDAGEGVQRAGEADIGQTDGERGQQGLLAVAHGGVAAHMSLDLRLSNAPQKGFLQSGRRKMRHIRPNLS